MAAQHSIAEARSKLPQLVREAESGKAVELTRRGEGVAVLIGRKQYEQLVSRTRRFSEAWDAFRSQVDVRDLQGEPADAFAGVRDKAPGREPKF